MIDLDMGRHALFVWPAWGISALVLGGLIVRALVAARRTRATLAALEQETQSAQTALSAIAPQVIP